MEIKTFEIDGANRIIVNGTKIMWASLKELDALGDSSMSYEEKFKLLLEYKKNRIKIDTTRSDINNTYVKVIKKENNRGRKPGFTYKESISAYEAFTQFEEYINEKTLEIYNSHKKYKEYIMLDKEEIKAEMSLFVFEQLKRWEEKLTTKNYATMHQNIEWVLKNRMHKILGLHSMVEYNNIIRLHSLEDRQYEAKYEGKDLYKIAEIEDETDWYTDTWTKDCVTYKTPINIEEVDELADRQLRHIPEISGEYNDLVYTINELLKTLTEREQEVLNLRFGLADGRSRTLDEVSRGLYVISPGKRQGALGISRDRVRQIEAKALRKLRHPSRTKKIRGYEHLYYEW